MPASTTQPVEDIKEYDARSAAIVVGGTTVGDIESFSWDQTKNHELTRSLDSNAIWVHGSPELTGEVVMHQSSPSIPALEGLWIDETLFNITAQPAEGEDRGSLTFVGCMATDFTQDAYEIDGMPTSSLSWEAADRE